MNRKEVIQKTADYVRQQMSGQESGHDWWHVYRVWKTAVHIGKKENADLYVVEAAALLHDIADWKFSGDEKGSSKVATKWLGDNGVDEATVSHVCRIIDNLSFKGAGVKSEMQTLEGRVVQDADRLDAIGAIGIARAFSYGGHAGREMYNPDVKPVVHETFEQYRNSIGTTINHFYEKLLLLKGLMNTETAKKMAEKRHKLMEKYLKEFYREWEGKG
jgi:uncharacterized protein